MQKSFSLAFLNSLVPPVCSTWCTNAGYRTPAARVGSILIIQTWSACQSCFLSFQPAQQYFPYVTTEMFVSDYTVDSDSTPLSEPRQQMIKNA